MWKIILCRGRYNAATGFPSVFEEIDDHNDDDNEDDQLSEKDFEQRKAAKMEKIRKAMAAIKISQHDCTPQGYFTDSFRDDVLTISSSSSSFTDLLLFGAGTIFLSVVFPCDVDSSCVDG
jgi:hypothetical protein